MWWWPSTVLPLHGSRGKPFKFKPCAALLVWDPWDKRGCYSLASKPKAGVDCYKDGKCLPLLPPFLSQQLGFKERQTPCKPVSALRLPSRSDLALLSVCCLHFWPSEIDFILPKSVGKATFQLRGVLHKWYAVTSVATQWATYGRPLSRSPLKKKVMFLVNCAASGDRNEVRTALIVRTQESPSNWWATKSLTINLLPRMCLMLHKLTGCCN